MFDLLGAHKRMIIIVRIVIKKAPVAPILGPRVQAKKRRFPGNVALSDDTATK